ncbi:ribose 1,5-bisphosphokinase [Acerihabitans sp. TG2]|uniref:ribose 1,5-bisphosphokinase n=1 Tax=Acerihabitans sp. TG2 TaxID=3096008 RepID=UPI002B236396|nr:ribose 1,5-bisphosphokinase [Acerihabitans sp. TG2]MEA9389665.1 ribose 1,5-bisphosphokinase [Acerihabitans sp. TG2]
MADLFYLMGPSGSGKDSLLNALAYQPQPTLIVGHRYITRPASAGGENHIELSEAAFAQRRDRGLFALHWQAHQLRYALGIEIDLWLQLGLNVMVNGSRGHLATARLRYGSHLIPLCLQVAPEVLFQRLHQRARETPEHINQRLARASAYQHTLPADCLLLDNNGSLADTLAALRALLPAPHNTPYPQENPS